MVARARENHASGIAKNSTLLAYAVINSTLHDTDGKGLPTFRADE